MFGIDHSVNDKAFNEAKEAGKFKGLSEFAWVLFIDGKLAGTAETREGVFSIRPDEVGHIYQPNAEKKEIRMGGPKSVRKTTGA